MLFISVFTYIFLSVYFIDLLIFFDIFIYLFYLSVYLSIHSLSVFIIYWSTYFFLIYLFLSIYLRTTTKKKPRKMSIWDKFAKISSSKNFYLVIYLSLPFYACLGAPYQWPKFHWKIPLILTPPPQYYVDCKLLGAYPVVCDTHK